jgi:hypothetical protein
LHLRTAYRLRNQRYFLCDDEFDNPHRLDHKYAPQLRGQRTSPI